MKVFDAFKSLLFLFSKKVAILFTFQFTDELDTLVIATCSNFI